MDPKFSSTGREFFQPDFYLVASHGCGRHSLSYYLSWLGAPVLPEREPFIMPAKNDFPCPVLKNPVTYLYGLTIDKQPPDLQPVALEINDIPIVWTVRDPVEMLVSVFNYFLGDAVFGKGNPETLANFTAIPFFAKHVSICCLYDTLRNSIRSFAVPFVLETTDLMPATCINTLKAIAAYLDVPYCNTVENVSSISFNSYKNRLWSRQPAKTFPISALNYFAPVYLAPSHIFDFYYNQWAPSKSLATFIWRGQEITVGIPLASYKNYPEQIANKFFTDFQIESLKKYLDVWDLHCSLTRSLYAQYALTAERAVEAIRSNKKFRSRFLRLMDYELKDFAAAYPDIVKNWHYFNSI